MVLWQKAVNPNFFILYTRRFLYPTETHLTYWCIWDRLPVKDVTKWNTVVQSWAFQKPQMKSSIRLRCFKHICAMINLIVFRSWYFKCIFFHCSWNYMGAAILLSLGQNASNPMITRNVGARNNFVPVRQWVCVLGAFCQCWLNQLKQTWYQCRCCCGLIISVAMAQYASLQLRKYP